VHLWCRGASEPANVVVYVHGYRDDVDSAFTNHELASQFAKSKVDALFIAVAAPSGPDQPVAFGDLDELLELVGAPSNGRVLVVGHSGGNRTLKAWLRSPRVEEVVLLDGFYGESASWTKWLTARPAASLRVIGQHTWPRSEAWRTTLSAELREQVIHERANCGHMELVTMGEWLPRVIQESSLARTLISG
jgi:pimeloyl-ACP methyl ester carboxylesterase